MSEAVIVVWLCLCVLAAELLDRRTPLRVLGAALLVILLAAVLANLGLIPAGSSAARPVASYDFIFSWLAPLSVFWLLLAVDLRRIWAAGSTLLGLFVLGCVGTVLGALAGIAVLHGLGLAGTLGERLPVVAGMFVGTYTGGSVNFNAVAIHYGVAADGLLFAGAVVVDNVVTTVWMVVTLLGPRVLAGRQRSAGRGPSSDAPASGPPVRDREPVDPLRLAAVIALGVGAWLAAMWLAGFAERRLGVELPAMLIVTVLALILAQLRPWLERRGLGEPFAGAQALGMFSVYLFLAVVGAFCDLAALATIGRLGVALAVLAGTTVVVHGLLVFGAARLLRLDPATAAVASQANVGGGTTALALARSLGRSDLTAPAILVGSLGTALGTFLGFWVAGQL